MRKRAGKDSKRAETDNGKSSERIAHFTFIKNYIASFAKNFTAMIQHVAQNFSRHHHRRIERFRTVECYDGNKLSCAEKKSSQACVTDTGTRSVWCRTRMMGFGAGAVSSAEEAEAFLELFFSSFPMSTLFQFRGIEIREDHVALLHHLAHLAPHALRVRIEQVASGFTSKLSVDTSDF